VTTITRLPKVAQTFEAMGGPGASARSATLAGGTTGGPPATGFHAAGEMVLDDGGAAWQCLVPGTPGTWMALGSLRSTLGVQGVNLNSGYAGNEIEEGSDACTILGGGWLGSENKILGGISLATVVGGYDNVIDSTTGPNPSYIGGGSHNRITGDAAHATVLGSANTIAGGNDSIIAGGSGNTINSGNYLFIGGGLNNTASGSYGAILGGHDNVSSAQGATVCGGINNDASGVGATILGGGFNLASGPYSVAHGRQAKARIEGQFAHASGAIATVGDAQRSVYVLRRQTTDASEQYLAVDGGSSPLTVEGASAWMVDAMIVARRTATDAGEAKGWVCRFLLINNSATVSIVSLDKGAYGAPAWDVVPTVTAAGFLFFRIYGEAAKTINWFGEVHAVEVLG
jgi:hypothetical protein